MTILVICGSQLLTMLSACRCRPGGANTSSLASLLLWYRHPVRMDSQSSETGDHRVRIDLDPVGL